MKEYIKFKYKHKYSNLIKNKNEYMRSPLTKLLKKSKSFLKKRWTSINILKGQQNWSSNYQRFNRTLIPPYMAYSI